MTKEKNKEVIYRLEKKDLLFILESHFKDDIEFNFKDERIKGVNTSFDVEIDQFNVVFTMKSTINN